MRCFQSVVLGAVLLALDMGVIQAAIPDLSGKDPHWIQDPKTHCWAANPDPAENETITWTGGCQNNLLSGQGTLTWYLNGEVGGRDIGTFKDGQLTGRGAIEFSDGARYEGDFPGYGVLSTPSGRKFPAEAIDEDPGWSVRQANPNEVPEAR